MVAADQLERLEAVEQDAREGGAELPTDQHSAVADPLFRDPARGDYRLEEGSPAWGLGWKALPWPIAVPRQR